jgi:LEA14-like dessication related protein
LRALPKGSAGKVISYQASVKLTVNVPKAGPREIVIEGKGELPVPAAPRISVAQIKLEQRKLTEMKGVMSVKVQNVNEFPLDMEKMSYALKLAGADVAKGDVSQAVNLEAGGEQTVEIAISFKPQGMPEDVKTALSGDKAAYELSGSADFGTKWGKITMPFAGKGETALIGP